jgi:hypothetical protein
MSPLRCTALLILALGIAGCADKFGGRIEVNGEVRLKGEPIKEGIIMFEPLDGQDTRAGSPIIDGAYLISREYGLKPGKYLIRITAGDGKTPVNVINPDEGPGPSAKGGTNIISKELVPEKWNRNSKEQKTVTSENPNKIDFDIR